MNTTATKHCPGFREQAPHEVPADTEHFGINRQAKDGLAVYCRSCDKGYQGAWRARKAAVLAADAMEPGYERDKALDAAYALLPGRTKLRDGTPDDKPAPAPTRAATGPRAVFHDQLAMAASDGKAAGYTAELVGAVYFALPTDPAIVKTPAGQAALATVNEAKAAERRKRDADRKRTERAAAKAKQQQATA